MSPVGPPGEARAASAAAGDLRERLDRLDWDAMERSLRDLGFATTPPVLRPEECVALVALYVDEARFRKRIDMAQHRFGVGEYKYFTAPLPPVVETLRVGAYPRLAVVANRWMAALGERTRYPRDLAGFLRRCRRHGQTLPTPLILRYEAGGYNCLHQDRYGEVAFPLQLTCVLSRRGLDYTGGEFLLVEQRPRAQSVGHAVTLEQGEMIVFTNQVRPAAGNRGHHRVTVRHGVSRLLSGSRYTLGVIFHDAE